MHQIGVFQALSVTVTKAIFHQTPEVDHPVVTYTLEVFNKESQTSWTTTRSDSEFKELHAAICSALDRGHTCDAMCPWFFVAFQQKLPKKPLFRAPTNKRCIQANLTAYHELVAMLMAFIIKSKNRSCYRATERVSNILFDFLFRDCSVVDAAVYTSAKQRNSSSSSRSSRSSQPEDCVCSLCDEGSHAWTSWTRLTCGHVFHDECIVEAMNKCVECPQCNPTHS
ncbi:hypothetical protein LEN26_015155 [Aphanomyces euteiches]|nr:hypothetical protein LEN26_015155 [Aphanomyces euteiches]KAH9126548.1 hypothetical protein AeMF1_003034 [Aphanomyces euteiches]KAH9184938.1 hypothetical protein AeNC1_013084 [Aphanomyces euteiches]